MAEALQAAIEPFPPPLDVDAIRLLPSDAQEQLLERLASINLRMASLLARFLRLAGPANAADKRAQAEFQDPTGFVHLAKLVETQPRLSLEQQYEDFGLWRAILRTNANLTASAHAATEERERESSQPAGGKRQQPMESENGTLRKPTLADVMRASTAKHCEADLETIRQEPHMDESRVSALLGALESGSDLLQASRSYWLPKTTDPGADNGDATATLDDDSLMS